MLKDRYGRRLRYLRVSVTDRCNFRCLYCSRDFSEWLPREDILSLEEIREVVAAAVSLGVERVRLTGGEPLVRRDFPHLVRMLSEIPGLRDLSLTTNGYRLAELARELKQAGLHRVNLSLDTLKAERFRELTGVDGLSRVLSGLEAALSVGLHPVKVNMVVMRGVNEDEILEMARLSLSEPLEVRFIEFMPVGPGVSWEEERFLPLAEIMERVRELGPLEEVPSQGGGPARVFRLPGARGRVGFIAAISRHFCDRCNRLRLTAEGRLRLCLFSEEEFDLRPYLGRGPEVLREALLEAVRRKPFGKELSGKRRRPMRAIGG
ncbi:GTP 3',8-cyclase MoaA [Thermosulfurimonas marina]|uniref:GTP 3',8-cyclase n=1 Tax=Thermosulfurimonas marina TaxID=2047767 RepID=A0A6H1WRJ6_9BACT|nr:GTP 3',8-cyclase MoaA [Thermosulfurimonas marina]QJA05801.1 GTP 3',8-cyclase MoaA [Thermosulfurimonas marina]